MTAMEKAMEAARNVTELFGREEEVVRAVLMAVLSEMPRYDQSWEEMNPAPKGDWIWLPDTPDLESLLNEEPK